MTWYVEECPRCRTACGASARSAATFLAEQHCRQREDGMDEQCEVCGDDLPEGTEHEHEAVVIRDGARGQYLAPTFVLDVADLVGDDKVDEDLRTLAGRWLDEMGSLRDSGLTEDEYEAVLDFSSYDGPSLLADAGYTEVSDDGYVIYKI